MVDTIHLDSRGILYQKVIESTQNHYKLLFAMYVVFKKYVVYKYYWTNPFEIIKILCWYNSHTTSIVNMKLLICT